uniref:GDSL esterase/lipase n=1 Tax=Leersia perrieri TaxID=77586 RepID=A0A0D9WP10_9ORYZ
MAALAIAVAVLAVAMVTGSSGVAAVVTANKPVIYIFGDSMSDVGNNNYLLLSLAKSDYPWYGVDYETGFPTGRFTNGRTIGDIMASKFGVPPPPPFMSLYMTDDEVLGGVNFASGGAGLLNETGIYFVQYLSFDNQISSFEEIKNAMIAKIGKKAAEEVVNGAIFQVGLGSNDYINNFLRPFMADGIVYTHEEFIGLLMDTMDRQLTRLYHLGARNVWFSGLAPLGCIPSQRVLSDDGGCLDDVNAYAVEFNAAAKNLLERLNAKLPGASMSLADCYSIVMELIEHPQKYGFETSHTSCCDVDTTVGGLCLPTAQLCDDRTAFVFWDAYHTSDAANQVIADRLYADMVSAGAVQGKGNATAAAAAPAATPRVVVGGGAAPSMNATSPPKP